MDLFFTFFSYLVTEMLILECLYCDREVGEGVGGGVFLGWGVAGWWWNGRNV